jgi:hypothetical protein
MVRSLVTLIVKSERDIEAIHLFQDRLTRMLKSRLACRLSHETLAVEIWKHPNGKFEAVFPTADDEDLAAFLLHLRLLIQDNDRISVRRISKLLSQLQVSQDSQSNFENVRGRLNTWLDSAPIAAIGRESPKTNRELLQTFLYGQHAHHSEPHYSRFKEMSRVAPDGSLDAQFLELLQRLVSFSTELLSAATSIEMEWKARDANR